MNVKLNPALLLLAAVPVGALLLTLRRSSTPTQASFTAQAAPTRRTARVATIT